MSGPADFHRQRGSRARSYAHAHACDQAARAAFTYLSATDPLPDEPVDAVIGFGTFDLALARFCGALQQAGRARHIVFTGGIGAGTADLGGPEADAWRAALLRAYPNVDPTDVVTENRSTNTAENIAFTAERLRRHATALSFGSGIRSALLVASPSRLRRVGLTMAKLQPNVRTYRCIPPAHFDRERAMYDFRGIDFIAHLRGELDRLVDYPARGWIAAEPLPLPISGLRALLRPS